MLLHNSGQETTDADTVTPHNHRYCSAIFIQDISVHAVRIASSQLEDVANLNPTSKLENTLAVWRNFTLTNLTDIHILSSKVTTLIDTSQVVTIFVSTHHSVSQILHLAVSDDSHAFWQIDWP